MSNKVLVAASAGWLAVGMMLGGSMATWEARAAGEARFKYELCRYSVAQLTDLPGGHLPGEAVRAPNGRWCVLRP